MSIVHSGGASISPYAPQYRGSAARGGSVLQNLSQAVLNHLADKARVAAGNALNNAAYAAGQYARAKAQLGYDKLRTLNLRKRTRGGNMVPKGGTMSGPGGAQKRARVLRLVRRRGKGSVYVNKSRLKQDVLRPVKQDKKKKKKKIVKKRYSYRYY